MPGVSKITDLNPNVGIFTENIGILPIYRAATISTKGLEWDVQDWKTEMGGMVSTSNHAAVDSNSPPQSDLAENRMIGNIKMSFIPFPWALNRYDSHFHLLFSGLHV